MKGGVRGGVSRRCRVKGRGVRGDARAKGGFRRESKGRFGRVRMRTKEIWKSEDENKGDLEE